MKMRISAGLVVYRIHQARLEVFLAHPGGPFFAHRDEGFWTIPKGEVEEGEEMQRTAVREFQEEIGVAIRPNAQFLELGGIRQKGGKIVHAWAVEQPDVAYDVSQVQKMEMEWPPESGRVLQFPEVDRAEFFPLSQAKVKIKNTQVPLLERLAKHLGLTVSFSS